MVLHGIVLLASARGLYLARHLPTLLIVLNLIQVTESISGSVVPLPMFHEKFDTLEGLFKAIGTVWKSLRKYLKFIHVL